MSLDHDTGSMSGTVLRGQFAGLRVEELGVGDLLALLRECRAEDEEGARLLEAYLDRLHPDWRDELAGGRGSGAGASRWRHAIDERRCERRGGLRDPRREARGQRGRRSRRRIAG